MKPVQLIRAHQPEVVTAWRRVRQQIFVMRVKLMAKWERATVEFDLAPDVRIGSGVRVYVWPGTHTTFKLGARSRIGDNVTIHMKGGSFTAGIRTDLRAGVAVQ